ncbi:hypothetical protein HDV00_001831 [Rhizophlyctis rosea]|nr:hypothetical protein HDV00_001831 [Rhizophlyctis rosea]
MAKAEWNGAVIAETDKYETVEGNVYFPASSIKKEYFKPSNTHTTCGWKGGMWISGLKDESYYTISVNGKDNADAAWYYPEPKSAAENIKDHVAFWKGVTVTK